MKILICGKGGSGKSIITAVLAKNLIERKYRVLVVDADESNFGLSAQLGVAEPKELMEQIGGKNAIKNKMGKVQGDGHKAPVFSESLHIQIYLAILSRKKTNCTYCRSEKSSITAKAAHAQWVYSPKTS